MLKKIPLPQIKISLSTFFLSSRGFSRSCTILVLEHKSCPQMVILYCGAKKIDQELCRINTFDFHA